MSRKDYTAQELFHRLLNLIHRRGLVTTEANVELPPCFATMKTDAGCTKDIECTLCKDINWYLERLRLEKLGEKHLPKEKKAVKAKPIRRTARGILYNSDIKPVAKAMKPKKKTKKKRMIRRKVSNITIEAFELRRVREANPWDR